MTQPLFSLENPCIERLQISLSQQIDVLRLDKVHPIVSGNKYYKLAPYIAQAIKNKSKGILTFGGGYSNHLVASAFYCKHHNMPCVGIVRGDYQKNLTPSLQFCLEQQMQLIYTPKNSYQTYKTKTSVPQEYSLFSNYYVIPEGGYGHLGTQGIEHLFAQINTEKYSHIAVAVGTGTTLAGIANTLQNQTTQLIGFVPMKNNQTIFSETQQLLHRTQQTKPRITFVHDYHFGGFGKQTEALKKIMHSFEQEHHFHLDQVYTAKAMFGLLEHCRFYKIPSTAQILFIHTGGLQGNHKNM